MLRGTLNVGDFGTVVNFLADAGAINTPAIESIGADARLTIKTCDAVKLAGSKYLFHAEEGGRMEIDCATVTGVNAGATLQCRSGALTVLRGSPVGQIGEAAVATDWDNGDGSPFDSTAFGSNLAAKNGLGQIVRRDSPFD